MNDSSNKHQKVQEMCDCYATTDPLKEMSKLQHEADAEEASIKWIALAVLHGINNNAEEISINKAKDGSVRVIAEYRKAELPSPDESISQKIIDSFKEILHVDSSQGDSTLAFGFRNGSMDLKVRTREESGDQKVTIKFP